LLRDQQAVSPAAAINANGVGGAGAASADAAVLASAAVPAAKEE